MTRKITDDLYWITQTQRTNSGYIHISPYLFKADDGFILIDPGPPTHSEEIRSEIKSITEESGGVKTIILTKVHPPNSANTRDISALWPNLELFISTGAEEVYDLTDLNVKQIEFGTTLTVNGRDFTFIQTPFVDVQHTTWVYDEKTKSLATSDAFGVYHDPSTSDKLSNEFDPENIDLQGYHEDMFLWLKYVDPDLVSDYMDKLFQKYDVEYILPNHGHPIVADDVDEYIKELKRAIRNISNNYVAPM